MSDVFKANEVKLGGKLCNLKKITTKSGLEMTTGSIAKTRKDKKTEQWFTSFFNFKSFGNIALDLAQVPDKSKIAIEGWLGQDEYEDKKTGEKRTNNYIMVKSFVVEGIKEQENKYKEPSNQSLFPDDSGDIPF